MRNALLIAMEYNACCPLWRPRPHGGVRGLLPPAGDARQGGGGHDGVYRPGPRHEAVPGAQGHDGQGRGGRSTAAAATARWTPHLDQYYNMYEVLKDHMEIVTLAEAAMKAAGIENPTHLPSGRHRRRRADLQGPAVPQSPQRRAQCPRPVEFAPVGPSKTGVQTVKGSGLSGLVERIILGRNNDHVSGTDRPSSLAAMEQMGLEQMIVSDPDSIWYLTGYYVFPLERLFALYLRRDGKHKLFLNPLFPVPEVPYEQVWFSDTDDLPRHFGGKRGRHQAHGHRQGVAARFLCL